MNTLMANDPIISVRQLNVTLSGHHILHNVSFDIMPGEITCVVGPNGSGKTTLIKVLLGLMPYEGVITVLHGLPGAPQGRLGYVPQELGFDRTMPLLVRDLLGLFADRKDRNNEHYLRCLRRVGAEHLLPRRLGELSGGEFQRVIMTLALHRHPQLLILDEPASGVDVEGEAVFYEILDSLRTEEGLSILLVSHDLSVVYHHATSVLCLNHELICHGRPQEVLTATTLGKLYGPGAIYHHPERPHPEVH